MAGLLLRGMAMWRCWPECLDICVSGLSGFRRGGPLLPKDSVCNIHTIKRQKTTLTMFKDSGYRHCPDCPYARPAQSSRTLVKSCARGKNVVNQQYVAPADSFRPERSKSATHILSPLVPCQSGL